MIDEKVRIFRIDVWLIPPSLPVVMDSSLIRIRMGFIGYNGIRDSGAIFCQVIRIREFFQFNPSMIFVNQKCRGGAPNFIMMGIMMRRFRPFVCRFMIISIRVLEARAWTRKYLILVSVEWGDLEEIKGRNDSRLISRASQIVNHELAAVTVRVLEIRIRLKRVKLGLGIGKRIFSCTGYEPISLILAYFSLWGQGGCD